MDTSFIVFNIIGLAIVIFAAFRIGSTVSKANRREAPESRNNIPYDQCLAENTEAFKYGTVTDARDGETYRTVKIGKQTWMAENLNYKTEKSYCYGFDSTKCLKYGRLYSWEGAKDACPTGWHVPKLTDWMTLFFTVKDTLSVGRVLRSSSDWKDLRENEYGNGTDDYGFSALPGGYINGSARDLGHKAYFWGYTNDGKTYSIKFGGAYDDLGCELQKEKEEKNRYPTSKLLQWHRYDSSHDIDVLQNKDLCLPKNYNSVVWEYISEDANLSVRCVKDEISRK